MNGIDIIVHWLHLMGAIIWVGGMIFAGWMLSPVPAQELPPHFRSIFFKKIGRRFYIMAWMALGVSIATGIYRIAPVWAGIDLTGSRFGVALLVKLGLILVMLTLSSLHDFSWGPRLRKMSESESADAPEYSRLASKVSLWARVNVAATVLLVLAGAFLRSHF